MRAVLFYYVLLPILLIATLFLGYFSIRTSMRFGKWGEESIVESTLVVAREKISRVEQKIIENDNTVFRLVDFSNPADLEDKLEKVSSVSKTVSAVLLFNENGDVLASFSRQGRRDADRLVDEFTNTILQDLQIEDSLNFHRHLHRKYGSQNYLISYISTIWMDERYTICLVNDLDFIVRSLFPDVFAEIGKDRVLNVVNNDGEIIFGEKLSQAGEFMVSLRFPTTLYNWRLQLAPRQAAFFTASARHSLISYTVLLAMAFGVTVVGLVVLSLAAFRERRLSQLKSDFISNVSHELKTPLSLIQMYSELLLMSSKEHDNRSRKHIDIIRRESERLSTLIDNALDFDRIERGRMGYDFRPCNLGNLVERGVEMYRLRIQNEPIHITIHIENDLPMVRCDEQALTLVLLNLLDNAWKYGRGPDPIRIEVKPDGPMASLSVSDSGRGIRPEDIRRIFERFYRSPDPDVRRQRGSGIGLALVKGIIEAHGGHIDVRSSPDTGTVFTVRLPFAFSLPSEESKRTRSRRDAFPESTREE